MMPLITGVGLATSVGDAAVGAAAIRAGISRPSPLDFEQPGGGDAPESLIGHPVRGLTDGTYLYGRWVRLAHAALVDLASRGVLGSRARWDRTAMIVAVPDHLEERYPRPEAVTDEELATAYVGRLLALLGWPLAPGRVSLVRRGQVGPIEALQNARALLSSGHDRVIVLAADTFVESPTLAWLHERGRLKTPDNPVGVAAGEAAAAVMLEAPRSADDPRAPTSPSRALAVLDSTELETEPGFDARRDRGLGRAMSAATERALRRAGATLPFAGDLYVDLDGEEGRAYDFGVMLTRLGPGVLAPGARTRLPAVALGHTGAAGAAVGLVLGVRSLVRGYAVTERVLVVARDGGGHVGAASLSRAPTTARNTGVDER
jgi:3-oxoacyl-[acyl-carrier-protein] synthase-1